MFATTNANTLRRELARIVERVRKGEDFTVLYRKGKSASRKGGTTTLSQNLLLVSVSENQYVPFSGSPALLAKRLVAHLGVALKTWVSRGLLVFLG